MKQTYKHRTYIWQHNEWPHFTWDSDALLEPLANLSRMHGELTGKMAMLGFTANSNANLDALTDELVTSSQIEGVTLNADSVRSSIARRLGLEYDGSIAEDHYVEGLVEVMLDAMDCKNGGLTEERLFGWHCALFPTGRSGMYKITVGGWRTGDEPMQVVSGAYGHEKVHYQAPPSYAVPQFMDEYINWFNSANISPFIRAAVAHLWFVTIHPFDDGNGRISRTLSDMCLASLVEGNRRYYSISAEINRRKKSYYDILEKTQKGTLEITEWLLWFINCASDAIVKSMSIAEMTLAKANYWRKFEHVEVNGRQRKIINRLWDGFDGKLTTSKWAKMCSCSQDTALRDIKDLIAKGMLRDSGKGGRSANYLLP